jgi:hypothetical protein
MNEKTHSAQAQELVAYARKRLDEGASKVTIRDELQAVGWSEGDADSVYAKALVAGGAPVPETGSAGTYAKKASTLDTVINLSSFLLLAVVVTALGTLYFQIINYFFPDPLSSVGYYAFAQQSSAILYAIAALLVAFPLYCIVVRFWFKRFWEETSTVESKLTQWLTYLVLLVAAVTIVGDLIWIIYKFLGGEMSIRFFLKTLTILGIAGAVFGFYYYERKKIQYREDVSMKTFRMFAQVLGGVVVIGLVLGFIASGSPGYQRDLEFDQRRANDLSQLSGCVTSYAREFDRFPENLDELERQSSYYYCAKLRDPETDEPYDYQVVRDMTIDANGIREGAFELCATFTLSTRDAALATRGLSQWHEHDAGYECKSQEVSYKPQVQVPLPTPVSR